MPKNNKKMEIYVVSVDMGYGHQRATYPLQDIAYKGKVLHINNYEGIPKSDEEIWEQSQYFYNFISRFKQVPLLGDLAFRAFDKFQEIKSFYPRRDLSRPSLQLWSTMNMIKRKNWGQHFIEKLEKKPLPLVTSFFVPAYMAEYYNYSEDIYLIVCDADISRAWASYDPKKSRIKYLAPSQRVVDRLKQYGVLEQMIYYTGFPLPKENVGQKDSEILKKDLARRLKQLDPFNKYCSKYGGVIKRELGIDIEEVKKEGPLAITFAVGGAGAQRETGIAIVKSLRGKIMTDQVKVNLIAGTHKHIYDYFVSEFEKYGLAKEIGRGVEIIYQQDKYLYFHEFNQVIRKTDILWTKPSELSFYCALGLPIIMSEPIGSQEEFNKRWLLGIGAGVGQGQVKYTDEWLFDWLNSGWFAESAMHGYFEAAKYGKDNIEKILMHKEEEMEEPQLVLQY